MANACGIGSSMSAAISPTRTMVSGTLFILVFISSILSFLAIGAYP
jgi:hypothetical protein